MSVLKENIVWRPSGSWNHLIRREKCNLLLLYSGGRAEVCKDDKYVRVIFFLFFLEGGISFAFFGPMTHFLCYLKELFRMRVSNRSGNGSVSPQMSWHALENPVSVRSVLTLAFSPPVTAFVIMPSRFHSGCSRPSSPSLTPASIALSGVWVVRKLWGSIPKREEPF